MILVTGATGFVGRHLVTRLMAEGYRVRCLIPAGQSDQLPWENLPEIIEGNVFDEEVLFRAVSGVHVIFHLANAQWWGRPRDLERIELVGTRNLVAAARAARVGRIITLSHLGLRLLRLIHFYRSKGWLKKQFETAASRIPLCAVA